MAAALESFGVYQSHQAVFQWIHRVGEEAPDPLTAAPSRVAVDETTIQIGREQCCVYAAIDVDSKLLLGVIYRNSPSEVGQRQAGAGVGKSRRS